jgi:hypothetical protein
MPAVCADYPAHIRNSLWGRTLPVTLFYYAASCREAPPIIKEYVEQQNARRDLHLRAAQRRD